jgi:hypothetical protein
MGKYARVTVIEGVRGMRRFWVMASLSVLPGCGAAPQTEEVLKEANVLQSSQFAEGLDEMRSGDRLAGPKGFRVYKDSKIYTKTIVDPAFRAHPDMNFYGPKYWDRNVAGVYVTGKKEFKKFEDRVRQNSVSLKENHPGIDDGKNIRITLFFGLNKVNQPYTMSASIRQGDLFWTKAIVRNGARNWTPLGDSVKNMGPHHDRMANIFGYDLDDLTQIVSDMFCLAEECA